MSSHFSACQYESAFSPQRLQNYEVPLRHKQHPSLRSGSTQIISNSRGHLNPDVSCSPASPWGSFVGTWQAQRRPIQLRTKTKFMTHLSQIDKNSRKSSRATSARVSQASQRGDSATSPRPHSAVESEQGDRGSQTAAPNETENKSKAGSKPQSPTTKDGSQPPTPATEAGSKPPTPATEAGSKPPTPATGRTHSKPPTPAPGSPVHPQPAPRATSAASSRTSVSSRSRITASRAQSAAFARGTPQHEPPLPDSSIPSRVSSAVLSRGTESPSPSSTQPQTPITTNIEEPNTST